jgi:hypothetical protein
LHRARQRECARKRQLIAVERRVEACDCPIPDRLLGTDTCATRDVKPG